MNFSDGPPGAEGYQDSVVELPKKISQEETCTKAEQEFQEHLKSLKIKLEDGSTRCMVERRGRDVSGKWIYLCFPCAAMCSGESILQTHISGKKHKNKLSLKSIWPMDIFEKHPLVQSGVKNPSSEEASEKILQKMAEEVDLHNKAPLELDVKYNKYRNVRCHIQDTIDSLKVPLIGLEYLLEHPPEEEHHEPTYWCLLCSKPGHPRTIINHFTCFWHRYNYLVRYFPKAHAKFHPFRTQQKYRDGVNLVMNRLAQRIQDKYGRLKPVNIDKLEFEKNRDSINRWIFSSKHFVETPKCTFEEVVDIDLITMLHETDEMTISTLNRKKDPSPPVVEAPSRPQFNKFTRTAGRQQRRTSIDSLSDASDEYVSSRRDRRPEKPTPRGGRGNKSRYEPYPDKRQKSPTYRTKYALKNAKETEKSNVQEKQLTKSLNYEYKVKLLEKKKIAESNAQKTLAYHEKNPEKHPLYPEEWKKFWNRRYKEIQAEGKDAAKYDYKPEWIVFWTKRMKELHDEELRLILNELYRKMNLTLPEKSTSEISPKASSPRRRSPEKRRRSPEYSRRRTPDSRRKTSQPRRRSPERRTPDHLSQPAPRQRSPRTHLRKRSRSPIPKRSGSPLPVRPRLELELGRRSPSPLSCRDESGPRNRSPVQLYPQQPQRPRHHQPSSQTVVVSDDDGRLSPWNSDESIDSAAQSIARSARSQSGTGSVASRAPRSSAAPPRGAINSATDLGPAENVVATLRLLVALEDYLGSIGPKIVNLLTEALTMEKERANASEQLLERETAMVLIETAKEKLKGAAQAGLVPKTASKAVRAAVLRAAATLHEADTRFKRQQKSAPTVVVTTSVGGGETASDGPPVSVTGVGAVDRAEIAQQMAEALIAQGKTDVSAEELAQLVDAVVGMAEAKKREEAKMKEEKSMPEPPRPKKPQPHVKTSALQMLQSAYDETDKRIEASDKKNEVSEPKIEASKKTDGVLDAMDGLSDSDLETLLKNFNELSAEEQHSLIAYLKKLEAQQPVRVEKLRQYVSAAAAAAPIPEEELPVKRQGKIKQVNVVSDDDDDYTVEELFKSATEKVKENQIHQEILKKSLKETNITTLVLDDYDDKLVDTIDLTRNISSATDVFELVQASIQSSTQSSSTGTPGLVTVNAQPRSFGDPAESFMSASRRLLTSQNKPHPLMQSQNLQLDLLSSGSSLANNQHRAMPIKQQQVMNPMQHNPEHRQNPMLQRNLNQQQLQQRTVQHNTMQQLSPNNPMPQQHFNNPLNNEIKNPPFNSDLFGNRTISQSSIWESRPKNNMPINKGIPNKTDFDNNLDQDRPYNQGPRGGNFINNDFDNNLEQDIPYNQGLRGGNFMNNDLDNHLDQDRPYNQGSRGGNLMNNDFDNDLDQDRLYSQGPRSGNFMNNDFDNNLDKDRSYNQGPRGGNFMNNDFDNNLDQDRPYNQGPTGGNFINNPMHDNRSSNNNQQNFGNHNRNSFDLRGGVSGSRGLGRGGYN